MRTKFIEGQAEILLRHFITHKFWVRILIENNKMTIEVPGLSSDYLANLIIEGD